VNYSDDLRSRIEAQIAARRRGDTKRRAHEADAQYLHEVEEPQLLTSSPIADTQVIEPVPTDERAAARLARRNHVDEAGRTTHHRHRRGRAPRHAGFAFRLAVLVGVAAVLALMLRTFVVEPFWIPSESMEPTLHGCSGCNNDRLLVDKLSYKLHAVHRGDVVVFSRPPGVNATEKVLIKRVIGLPGESVSGRDGRVWIGARPLQESYVNPACHGTTDFDPVTVPRGDYFVMGDNRCDSTDSRVFGPIKKSTIIGRAFVIIWPLGRIHWL
jgi:signal peptidase I